MNKRAGIAVGVLAGIGITGGLVGWWLNLGEPVSLGESTLKQPNVISEDQKTGDEEYVGAPVPNIINRAGTIKNVKKNRVIINGANDEDVNIYINNDTEIYGADGSEKDIEDLKVGMYITVDIDGDEIEEGDTENVFDAMIIYISGK